MRHLLLALALTSIGSAVTAPLSTQGAAGYAGQFSATDLTFVTLPGMQQISSMARDEQLAKAQLQAGKGHAPMVGRAFHRAPWGVSKGASFSRGGK